MEDGITIDTPHGIHMYRLFVLRSALKLEIKGLRMSRGATAYSVVKREFGFKGTREAVYTQLCEHIEKERALG